MEDVCVLSNFFLRSSDPVRSERLTLSINNNVNRLIANIFGIDQNDQDCEYVNIEDASIDDTLDDIAYSTIGIDTPSTSAVNNVESPLLGHARGGVDWMRKLAVKYQHIKDTYNSYKNNFAGLLERTGNTDRAELLALKSAMDPLTQGWTESVGQCLKLIIDRSSREHYANVLLTSENIISTLAKLLIMEQSSMIPPENVYSMMKIGKEAVIDRILSHFGKKCSFVIISTHLDTHEIAKKVCSALLILF
uniref:Eyes absent homolog n=1 Tax=Setaria digitata TaxID=48799 RepID=A0A915Q7D8_9BILA